MIANLILSGGPTHAFAVTSAAVVGLLSSEGVDSTVVDDPHEAIERLADPGRTWDLVTVNALRWSMGADRYAALREEWACTLDVAEAEVLVGHVRRGGGLLALHTAVICFDTQPAWRDLVGAAWDWDRSSHPPLGEVDVTVTDAGDRHPLTAGIGSFAIPDEAYGFLDEEPDITPLLTAAHGGRDHPLLWAREVGAGRVVTDLLGHDESSFSHPTHAEILRRASRWAVRTGAEEPS